MHTIAAIKLYLPKEGAINAISRRWKGRQLGEFESQKIGRFTCFQSRNAKGWKTQSHLRNYWIWLWALWCSMSWLTDWLCLQFLNFFCLCFCCRICIISMHPFMTTVRTKLGIRVWQRWNQLQWGCDFHSFVLRPVLILCAHTYMCRLWFPICLCV